MDNDTIQKKCQDLLKELGVPGFIVFGWEKSKGNYGFVYSNRKTPPNVVAKGMSWALHDFAQKKL